ncbi:alanine--tRNA ligase, partial [bacterium]|nr:alanine--tRNA ligase [bacterium]
PQVFEFFTQIVGLDPKRLYVTVFGGDQKLGLAADEESITIWQQVFAEVGIDAKVGERIFTYGPEKNWWSRSGTPDKMPVGEPGGSDSEIFYDFGTDLHCHEHSPWADKSCHPNCDCGRFIEIGNSVFMQYQKTADGKFIDLPQKNVDYGGGLERAIMAQEHCHDIFQSSVFKDLIAVLEDTSGKKYQDLDEDDKKSWRIIADHLRSSVFLLAEGLQPSNKEQGYVLRRLLRRSLVAIKQHGLEPTVLTDMVAPVAALYQDVYPQVGEQQENIQASITAESQKFAASLNKGLKQIAKMTTISGEDAFYLYESYGFPLELTREIAAKKGITVDEAAFEAAKQAHRQKSQTSSAGKFKGGLADHSQETVRFHTATHLLLAALQKQLDPKIYQKGSNITGERARFDFAFGRALTPEEMSSLEQQINTWIDADLTVKRLEMPKDQALELVGGSVFADRYPDQVSVYQIEDASIEICVGPHVTHTGEIGHIKLTKQQSAGSGLRRIYIYFA